MWLEEFRREFEKNLNEFFKDKFPGWAEEYRIELVPIEIPVFDLRQQEEEE